MGVIQRQGTKQTVVNYLATAIAALSTLFIYPREEELYGLWLTLFGMAAFFLPLASLGINSVTIKYFPQFRDGERGHQGFLPFLLFLSVGFFLLFSAILLAFEGPFFQLLEALRFEVGLIRSNLLPILGLTFFALLQSVLVAYISNFQRIVIPAVLTNLWPKVALPGLILLAWLGWLDVGEYVLGLLMMQAVTVLGLLAYLGLLGELRLWPRSEVWRSGKLRQMAVFGLFGMLGSLGSLFAFRLDHVMITMMAGVGSTGIYGIAQFIGTGIEMPTRSIYAISGPIIAKAWEENDLREIRTLYTKASLNLLLIGLPIYGMVLLSLDDLFRLTTKYEALQAAAWVVYLIGLGKLVDMACSVNGQIIGYSRYYRFNLVAVLILGAINVVLNYMLIPRYGIVGAAWASFLAIAGFNVMRSAFVWWTFGMQPFSWRTAAAVALAAGASGIAFVVPDLGVPWLDILQNSLLLGLLYFPVVLWIRLSPDLNDLVRRNWNSWRHK